MIIAGRSPAGEKTCTLSSLPNNQEPKFGLGKPPSPSCGALWSKRAPKFKIVLANLLANEERGGLSSISRNNFLWMCSALPVAGDPGGLVGVVILLPTFC